MYHCFLPPHQIMARGQSGAIVHITLEPCHEEPENFLNRGGIPEKIYLAWQNPRRVCARRGSQGDRAALALQARDVAPSCAAAWPPRNPLPWSAARYRAL